MRSIAGMKNEMSFGDGGCYRCHCCGGERNRIEDVRPIKKTGGVEVELTLSCDHCTSLAIFQITGDAGHLYMGVVAQALNTLEEESIAQCALERFAPLDRCS